MITNENKNKLLHDCCRELPEAGLSGIHEIGRISPIQISADYFGCAYTECAKPMYACGYPPGNCVCLRVIYSHVVSHWNYRRKWVANTEFINERRIGMNWITTTRQRMSPSDSKLILCYLLLFESILFVQYSPCKCKYHTIVDNASQCI